MPEDLQTIDESIHVSIIIAHEFRSAASGHVQDTSPPVGRLAETRWTGRWGQKGGKQQSTPEIAVLREWRERVFIDGLRGHNEAGRHLAGFDWFIFGEHLGSKKIPDG